eukprot:g38579.t1
MEGSYGTLVVSLPLDQETQLEVPPVPNIHRGSRGRFGPNARPDGISSSCIGKVGLERTHSSGGVEFEPVQYLVASLALVRSSEELVPWMSVEARWHRRL